MRTSEHEDREKEGDAERECLLVYNAWEETRFCNAETDARTNELRVALYETHQRPAKTVSARNVRPRT